MKKLICKIKGHDLNMDDQLEIKLKTDTFLYKNASSITYQKRYRCKRCNLYKKFDNKIREQVRLSDGTVHNVMTVQDE